MLALRAHIDSMPLIAGWLAAGWRICLRRLVNPRERLDCWVRLVAFVGFCAMETWHLKTIPLPLATMWICKYCDGRHI